MARFTKSSNGYYLDVNLTNDKIRFDLDVYPHELGDSDINYIKQKINNYGNS